MSALEWAGCPPSNMISNNKTAHGIVRSVTNQAIILVFVIIANTVIKMLSKSKLGSVFNQPNDDTVNIITLGACGFLVCLMIYTKLRFLTIAKPSLWPVGCCQSCGYDLSGHNKSGKCPECAMQFIIKS